MRRLSMPRRGHRLAYEGDGDPRTAPRPSWRTPLTVKVALKTMLLAAVLVASASGVFLGAQHLLPAGDRYRRPPGAGPIVATVPPPAAANEKAETVLSAAVEAISAPRTSAKVEPDRVPGAAAAHVQSAPLDAATPAPAPGPPRKSIAPALRPDEVEGYLAKGERLLKAGDVATARLFFARVAEAGEARGALAMARSFDPEVLRTLSIYGIKPNLEEAARWRVKAKNLGMSPPGR
jgi:hypothetical protein